MSSYPTSIDDFTTTHNPTDPKTGHAVEHNKMGDALEKIENELGTNPSGSYATVAAAVAAALAAGGGSGLYPNGVLDYGMGPGISNNGPLMQNMIDDLVSGGVGGCCYVPKAVYPFTSGVNIANEYGITIITDPIVSFNEGGGFGTVFKANTAGMRLFDGRSSGLVHAGPMFLGNPHFYAAANNVILVDIADMNHWFFERPNFGHSNGSTGVTMLRLDQVTSGGDNAYGNLLAPKFCSENSGLGTGCIGINAVRSYGFQMFGGNFNMGAGGYGVKLLQVNEAKFFGTKWNHGGLHVYCEGSSNEWHGCSFETFDPAGTVWAMEFVRPASPEPPQGKYNKVIGGTMTGNGGGAVKGIKVTDLDPNPNHWNAPSYNEFTCSFVNMGTPYQDYGPAGTTLNKWGDVQYATNIPDKSSIELDTPAEVAAVINSMLAAMRRGNLIY